MTSIAWFDGAREELAALFAEADDSPAAIASYRDAGRVLAARDGDVVVGHAQLVRSGRDLELKSLAVREERRGEGIGAALVARAIAEARAAGAARLLVATGAADTALLRFYQRCGFRMERIERDVFTPENGYPAIEVDGIPLLDRVWLSLDLER